MDLAVHNLWPVTRLFTLPASLTLGVILTAVSGFSPAAASSNSATRTYAHLVALERELLVSAATGKRALPVSADAFRKAAGNRSIDSWGRPLVYRVSNADHDAPFVLYSVGVNAIDENGGGDDITARRFSSVHYRTSSSLFFLLVLLDGPILALALALVLTLLMRWRRQRGVRAAQ